MSDSDGPVDMVATDLSDVDAPSAEKDLFTSDMTVAEAVEEYGPRPVAKALLEWYEWADDQDATDAEMFAEA